jgi:hypothetical protein
MTEKLKKFLWRVEDEGLEYALLHYFGRDITDEVDDEELLALWEQAYDKLEELNNYVMPLILELE